MKSDRVAWPILLLLLTALVPSLGVVWMMSEAVQNDRLAGNQRLADAYRNQLESASEVVRERWNDDLISLQDAIDLSSAASSFANIVSMGKCDSVVVGPLGVVAGALVVSAEKDSGCYPSIDEEVEKEVGDKSVDLQSEAWRQARALEFRANRYGAAAKLYEGLFQADADGIGPARAQESVARCLLKAGRNEEAIEVLVKQSKSATVDEDGRSFAANAELRLLQVLADDSPVRAEVVEALTRRLNDYQSPIRAPQRCFLMNEVSKLMPQVPGFPTHNAESIAVRYLEVTNVKQRRSGGGQLKSTGVDGLWQQASPDGRLTLLWSTNTINSRIKDICNEIYLPTGAQWAAIEPGAENDSLADVSLAPTIGFWKLGITTDLNHQSLAGVNSRTAVYVWITLLVVATTTVLAWILSGVVRKRLELAEQKNNLVANVSHELKTPLASIRLLVDTLLMGQESGEAIDSSQQSDYLKLIAQENTRLTRLINNFLTFSKLDQGKPSLNLQRISLSAVANAAVDVFADRTPEATDSIQLTTSNDSVVNGDFDALVTVLVNLLENAWKYNSEDKKEIQVSLDQTNSQAAISVSDNGMGIDVRVQRKIFDRFYQADSRMTRQQSGCGLGLSIVKAIVSSHGGNITVDSKPDRGSKFTILIPLAEGKR